jgi:hypothetical protein
MFTLTEKLVAFALLPIALPLIIYMGMYGMNDIKDACDAIEDNPDFAGLEIKNSK